MLTDSDGLAMLRENSIGHVVSKLSQIAAGTPGTRGVYTFLLGDGASRLNGAAELALHLLDGYPASALTTVFIFNNGRWAIEDNLIGDAVRQTKDEHVLYNRAFYDLISAHPRVCVCEDVGELAATLSHLETQINRFALLRCIVGFALGEEPPGLTLVIIRGINLSLPPLIGDTAPIKFSAEMRFMCTLLGRFAEGCAHKVPIFGCSSNTWIYSFARWRRARRTDMCAGGPTSRRRR